MSYFLFHNCVTGEDSQIKGLTKDHLMAEAERQGIAERATMDVQFDRNYGAVFIPFNWEWKQVAAAREVGMRNPKLRIIKEMP